MTITGNTEIDAILNLNPPKPMTEQEKILKEFNRNIASIAGLLEEIKNLAVESHMNVSLKKVDWSTVGDTDHVIDQLTQIVRFLNNKEE